MPGFKFSQKKKKGIPWVLQTILPDPELVQLRQQRCQESEPY